MPLPHGHQIILTDSLLTELLRLCFSTAPYLTDDVIKSSSLIKLLRALTPKITRRQNKNPARGVTSAKPDLIVLAYKLVPSSEGWIFAVDSGM